MLRLATVQYTPVFGDKEANFQCLSALMQGVEADLVIFPELCTTGYFFQSKEESKLLAELPTEKTAEFFYDMARRIDATIIAGFIEADADAVYNSAMIISPASKIPQVYRKTHLFYKERFCFDEGNTGWFVVPHHKKDCRIGVMICYDWRFPESARVLGLQGADIIACPSNLVTNVWHLAMPARALENKVYLAVPNRAGSERAENGEEVIFTGKSVVYGYNGAELAKANETDNTILYVEIDPHKTRDKSFNALNDIFTDRRPEMYKKLL